MATIPEDKQKMASQAPSSGTTKLPGTSEILFLKRLLYLKASIDNETTLNAMSVPFEQEKLRDMSSPEHLMLSSDGVLSQARHSAATYHSNVVLGEQKLAIAPEPPRTAAGGPRPRRHGLDMMSGFVGNDHQSNYRMPGNDHIDLSILDARQSTRGQK